MIEYIYLVKCPDRSEEPFDFFDEAKDFAIGCLGSNPIITQIEVDRNDFGECVDSRDLGTVWSWEDMVKETETEPAASVFTKDDLVDYVPETDPEFTALDNTLDAEVLDTIPDNFRKPIPDGMTIKDLVEEMADVLMYYNDVMLCYGITADELKQSYSEKFEKNMKRW